MRAHTVTHGAFRDNLAQTMARTRTPLLDELAEELDITIVRDDELDS